MVCKILWLLLVVSHGVRNCLSLSPTFNPATTSPLDFACYAKFSHSHAKMLVVGFLPLVFFLVSLIGLTTYCQAWQRAMKCSKALILHVFELQLALPWISQNSSSFLACFNDQIATKNTKTCQNWLVTLARFLNVPIELKGINYYSKVFKIVSFKW